MFHRLAVAFAQANERYGFDLVGIAEALQYTGHSAGHYLGWHVDMADGETAARKLSLTIQLSDPGDCDSGDLQFHGSAGIPVVRELGTGVFSGLSGASGCAGHAWATPLAGGVGARPGISIMAIRVAAPRQRSVGPVKPQHR